MAPVTPLPTVCDHRVLPRDLTLLPDQNGAAAIGLPPGRRRQVEVRGTGRAAEQFVVDGDRLLLPTGGPYSITVSDGDTIAHQANDVLVGDVWALAGQSNMMGGGALDDEPTPIDNVRMLGFDERWQPAVDPLHRLWENPHSPVLRSARRDVHAPMSDQAWAEVCAPYFAQQQQGPIGGVGPGSSFARELAARTGVPVGLVPCALGATSLYNWRRDWAGKTGAAFADTLYGNLVLRARDAGPLRGVAWYQGEGDSGPDPAPSYFERFAGFVEELRADLEDPQLPIVTVQISRYDIAQLKRVLNEDVDPADVAGWPLVRDAQRRVADAIANVAVVAAADLTLGDGVHLDRPAVDVLGRRMAMVAEQFVPGHTGRSSPRLVAVEAVDSQTVVCRFDSVDGELEMTGPCDVVVDGASVLDVRAEGDAFVVHVDQPLAAGATIVYGPGLCPRAALVDKGGLPVPLFGPVVITGAGTGSGR
ncbi:MAG: hypothetical protein QOK43_2160 [Acidimicrobiaceae bacterium]|nr:hypothetical protein [Acidimicrobiaceae bacterium]